MGFCKFLIGKSADNVFNSADFFDIICLNFFDIIPGGSSQDEKQFFTRRYIY